MTVRVLVSPKSYLIRAARHQIPADRYQVVLADFATADLTAFDAVIPTSFSESSLILQQAATGRAIPAITASPAVVALCHDKLAFNRHMIAAGFGAHIPAILPDDAPPPFILKLRRDSFGKNSHLVMDDRDLAQLSGPPGPPEYFRQAYVRSPLEYAAHFLLKDDQVRFHTTVEYDMGNTPYVRDAECRGTTLRRNFRSPFYYNLLNMLRAAGFTDGICCFDYKVDNGRLQVLELNPRFGGSLGGSLRELVDAYVEALDNV